MFVQTPFKAECKLPESSGGALELAVSNTGYEFIRTGSKEGKFAAPSDVQADPSKKIHGPLSAVLSSQMDQVHSAETMGEQYNMLPSAQQSALNESSNMGNAFIFAFAGHGE